VPRPLTASLPHCSIPVLAALALLAPICGNAQTPAVPLPLGTLVATQTVSGAAAIQFTGLAGNAAYLLQCHNIQVATNNVHLELQVGEGATPTWQTGSNYWFAGNTLNSSNGSSSITASQAATGIILDYATTPFVGNTGTFLNDYTIAFADLAQTAGYKAFDYTGHWWGTGPSLNPQTGSGAWHGDTNAITGVQLLASSGNISGTCNLYQLGGS
jgi:hypothetical protein